MQDKQRGKPVPAKSQRIASIEQNFTIPFQSYPFVNSNNEFTKRGVLFFRIFRHRAKIWNNSFDFDKLRRWTRKKTIDTFNTIQTDRKPANEI